MLTEPFAWSAYPGALLAFSLPMNHLVSPGPRILLSPLVAMQGKRALPSSRMEIPVSIRPARTLDPFPPGLLSPSQGGPADHLLSLARWLQHRQMLGQGSDSPHSLPCLSHLGVCVPVRATTRSPLSQKTRMELKGHSIRSQECWGQVPALPPPLCDLAQAQAPL